MNRRLAWISGKREGDSRWHEIEIWLIDDFGPRYFAWVKYNTNHPHEHDIEFTEYLYKLDHAFTYINRIDPTIGVKGYPRHENFRIKQDRLLEAIRKRFRVIAKQAIDQAREGFSGEAIKPSAGEPSTGE